MLPADLKVEQFGGYPPQGRQRAEENVALFRQLPLGFVPFLFKELIGYDWKFPAERSDLDRQLVYLNKMSGEKRRDEMSVFAQLRLTRALENFDWVNSPGPFIEQLSAHLWASHQMDAFRAASEAFIGKFNSATPKEPLPAPRLSIVVIGKGVAENKYPLFRKLRREGMHFPRVNPDGGLAAIVDAVQARAAKHPRSIRSLVHRRWTPGSDREPAHGLRFLRCAEADSCRIAGKDATRVRIARLRRGSVAIHAGQDDSRGSGGEKRRRDGALRS